MSCSQVLYRAPSGPGMLAFGYERHDLAGCPLLTLCWLDAQSMCHMQVHISCAVSSPTQIVKQANRSGALSNTDQTNPLCQLQSYSHLQRPSLTQPADAAASCFYSANPNNQWLNNAASGGFAGFNFPTLPRPLSVSVCCRGPEASVL